MKKVVNFRILLIFALTLLVASFTATYFLTSKNESIIIFGVLSLLFLVCLIFAICLKKKTLFLFASILILIALPFLNLYSRASSQEKYMNINGSEIVVYGRICENITETSGTNLKITLDSVHFISDEDEIVSSGKFIVYVNASSISTENFEVGRFVAVSSTVHFYSISGNDSVSLSRLSQNVIGYGTANSNYVLFSDDYQTTLRDKIKTGTFNLLQKYNVPYSSVGYTMMFGDKTLLDDDVQSIFKSTGIAHLLAVSGLHVSIIIWILSEILKKFKVPNVARLIILCFGIGFYAYLCEFSVSVLRAGFMAIFALLVKIRGKAYDNLSVLSLVATILLIINPLYIYNLSFILSFSSVLSIFLLSPPLTRLFEKVFKQKFASALALNCSVQFGLALTSAYYFGSINILSVICNLISVPIAICSFVILIFSCLIVLIFPFMSFLLQVYGWLIGLVVKFNFFISAHSPYIYFENFSIVYDLILKCLMFVISDYYFTCNQTKRVAMIVFVATCAQVVFLT